MRNLIQEIEQKINTGDIHKVRGALQNFIIWDMEQLPEILKAVEVAKQFEGVFVADKGEGFNTNQQKWDIDYLNEIKANLTLNFSEEKYRHLCKVAEYLHKQEKRPKQMKLESIRQSTSKSKPKVLQRPMIQDYKLRGNNSKKMLWIGLTLITVVLILVISLVKLVQR